ncbi:UNKNOWN [Stylonychia lemnae]|uniref:Uncharacterized protein n=1 Tax=Stylonychia lemnae TaxID=5949 RepID=A0A078AQQ5_STYLE|nr:UNKNOWN [Stylonychia lemnae]|eukprot:CDW83233.1 UNKNOWN [Stylonychia lemnae]
MSQKLSSRKRSTSKKREEVKQKAVLKQEISKDLELNFLKDRLLFYVEKLLIFNQINQNPTILEFQNAISVISGDQLNEIMEERVSLSLCCNISCQAKVSQEIKDKFTKRKLNINKFGNIEKIEQVRIFCDKPSNKSESKCEQSYKNYLHQVLNINDNGPFSSQFLGVVDTLERYYKNLEDFTNEMSFNIDVVKVQQSVEKFRQEQAKLIAPIVENKFEEVKAKANFKVNVVSNRGNPHQAQTKKQTSQLETQVTITSENEAKMGIASINSLQQQSITNQTVDIKDQSQNKQKKKSVKFLETEENLLNDKRAELKEEAALLQEIVKDQQKSTDNVSKSDATSENDDFGVFEFDDVEGELEDFRINEMSSFQKVFDLFLNLNNDNLYYYLNGRKSFEDSDQYLKTSTRDFFLRQLKINLEDQVLPRCQQALKKGLKDRVEMEIVRIAQLMDLVSLASSYDKNDWKSITVVIVNLVGKSFSNNFKSDLQCQDSSAFIKAYLIPDDSEQIIIDLFN